MRYDLTLALKDLAGVQITDAQDVAGYTLRTALVRTALFVDRGKLPSAVDKLTAYALAKRIAQANHYIDLSAEEVVFLKEQAGAMWSPLVLGQVWELLETPVTLQVARESMAAEVLNRGFDKPATGIPSN
jgi:hypothetical protein